MAEKKNLYQRMIEVAENTAAVGKNLEVSTAGGKKMYDGVGHDDVTKAVRINMFKAGVLCFPVSIEKVEDDEMFMIRSTYRFQNVDDPEDYMDMPSLGHGHGQHKSGGAVSYSHKMVLLKAFLLETGEDPEKQIDPEEPLPKKQPKKKTVATTTAAPSPSDWYVNELSLKEDGSSKYKEVQNEAEGQGLTKIDIEEFIRDMKLVNSSGKSPFDFESCDRENKKVVWNALKDKKIKSTNVKDAEPEAELVTTGNLIEEDDIPI